MLEGGGTKSPCEMDGTYVSTCGSNQANCCMLIGGSAGDSIRMHPMPSERLKKFHQIKRHVNPIKYGHVSHLGMAQQSVVK